MCCARRSTAPAFHEGAPGHHFQIALAQEMEGLPKFRRFGFYGAYLEGWGLYAEGLGQGDGLLPRSLCRFRPARASSCGARSAWSSIPASTPSTGRASERSTISRDNSLLSQGDIGREVERYFDDPGQATSYMIGQRRILELRERARRQLGTRFDIRDFHAVVLENGAVPLDTLSALVDAYIADKRTH